MKIPLLNIRVRRIQILGQECRSVGMIDQTIQCISGGKLQGTIHLSATVVRNLFDNFNVDCLASAKTYYKLSGDYPLKSCHDILEESEENVAVSSLESGGEATISQDQDDDDEDATNQHKQDEEPEPPDNPQPQLTKILGDNLNFIIEKDMARLNQIKCDVHTLANSHDDEFYDEDLMCDLCFYAGKPIKVTKSHRNKCPTCPSMTNEAKINLFGTQWKRAAKEIFEERHRGRKKEELRRHT